MTTGTSSTHKAKDGENNNERPIRTGEKRKIGSHPNVSDTNGLRRSLREKPSKKMISNPSSTRKSERLGKGTPTTPAVRRKSERLEKQKIPSPLRRSGRKSNSSSSPSDSKSSGSLRSKQKQKKEKSVIQLTSESKEIRKYEELDLGTSPVSTKRMNSRMYRSMFRKPKKGDTTLQMLVSRNSILAEDLVSNIVGHDKGEKLAPSNSKGVKVGTDSDVSAALANDENSNLIPDTSSSRLGGNIMGMDASCSKRIRLDGNPTVNESRNPSAELQDGGDTDASMLQKCSPARLAEVSKNLCLICNREGQLLFCGGKECNGCYHLSCLEPPLLDAPLGVWYCHLCVRKKIECGVYSVSEGVESVWDVKEVPFSNVDGFMAQKEYLVKYKGLAHVHNRWLPENQLLLEDPSLLMKFNQKVQILRLKPEWSLPHRLLQKRALISGKHFDDHGNKHAVDNFDCCYEWLVKWRGLGYEHATWELDNASFLCSPEGQSLIRGYEWRFQRAKRISSCSKLNKKPHRGSSVDKLSQLPGGVSSGFGNNSLLDAVNKLREHWHQGQNAIVIDDHERILKVVAFILSLHFDTYRPFLIITTAASLHSWEGEFYQLQSTDVVIYNGNKETRNSIRKIEFYDEGRCILFQVLIIVQEILIEDMEVLGGIEWEAIIVDECQSPKISSYVTQIMMLNTHLRVLLFRGQLKDSIVEDIMTLLDHQNDYEKDGLISNSNNSIVQLKERLSSHIAYRCKSYSFRFVEYWVPVQISHVQLEQYCATLLSNASILRSSSKIDSVGAIRDVLISIRKCCNHPYTVDPSLQPLLTKGLEVVEYLDVDIKASGKLQLLDSMLMELKKNDLRVLILFQSIGGSGRDSIGDILDDFLRLRFGSDSYERVDKSLSVSKKQAAMKKFNNKNDGRFVFLLETCACLPSIKLSSVDTIIIFDSDWNPMNDVRSLQKIALDSQFELIKIFRLYSSFTVEEKALILAMQDKTLDINLNNINRSISHMLLMWGSSYLFDELRVFHDGETSVSSLKSLFEQPLLKEAVHEFSSILSQDGEDTDKSNCSFLLKVQLNGGIYCSNFGLHGEVKLRLLDEEPPHIFWVKLFEGKQFRWKYSCSSTQRSRKRVHYFDGSVHGPDLVSEGIAKKRRKVGNNIVFQPSSKSEVEKLSTGIKAGTSGDLVDRPQGDDVESEKKIRLHGEQRSLHLSLKPQITKLCKVLLLPDNVKSIVDNFLEYVMSNHLVNWEPVSILQAFQISLIWTAASMLKHKLDHKASLTLAKQYLNFDCNKKEVDYIYSMLRCLKKIFLYRTGNYNDTGSPKASESSNRVYSCTGGAREVELFKKDMSKSIKDIRKKCEKKLKKLHLIQQEQKQRFKADIEAEKADFEKNYKLELAVIRSCSPNDVMRTQKLKVLNSEYDKNIVKLKFQQETRLKDLEDVQLAETLKFQNWETTWVQEVESWAQNELSNIVASKEHGTQVEFLQPFDQVQPHNDPKNHFAEGKDHDNMVEAMTRDRNVFPETNSPAAVPCSSTTELQNPLVKHIGADEMGIMVSEDRPVSRSEDHNIAKNQCYSQGNTISNHSHSRKQNSGGATRMTDEGIGCEYFSRGYQDGCRDDAATLVLPSSNGEVCDGETSDVTSREVAPEVCKTISSNDGQDEVHSSKKRKLDGSVNGTKFIASLNSQSPERHISRGNAMCLPDSENATHIQEADDCNGSNNSFTQNSPLSDERIADGSIISVLDKKAHLGMPGTSNGTDCPEKVTAVDHLSSMEQISEGSINVPVLDSVLSSRPCQAASPSISPATVSLLNPPLEQQISDGVFLSIPNGDIPVIVPENSHTVADCHNDIETLMNPMLLDGSTTSDQQEGVRRTMIEQNTADATEPLEQMLQLSSLEFPPDQNTAGEMQNSLEQVELVSSPVNVLPANQSNHVSLITNPSEQVQQFPSAELPSFNLDPSNFPLATEVEHQPINEVNLPSHDPEASTVVPNQDVVQPDSASEHDSHLVVHPDTRHLSTPMQTAIHSAYRMLPHLSYDPLENELERIQKVTEQIMKNHEEMKLQLKSDFEKELDELRRKYDIKSQEIEVEFLQTKTTLDTNLNIVLVNQFLADAYRSKCLDRKASSALGMHQDSSLGQQQFQLSRRQSDSRLPLDTGPSSCGPPATSLQSPSTRASSQQMAPHIQAGYSTSGVFSNVSAGLPLFNSITSPSGNIHDGGEIRAPAPHLVSCRPPTSVPASSLHALPHGMPARSNLPAASHGPPHWKQTTFQSDPLMGRLPDSAGGLPAPNSSINVQNVLSDVASVNLPRFGTSSSMLANSHQPASPDLVCLSDDD
ncbi:uncharacterized protein LOC133318648 [Gastrolobium bilobum]|uniref:uncharacterized protein LOC133318648 n=1 Tax=Gastrolobium bilobum TaxID=150636 RepID=UPI002AAFC733|nr:uncharacterized protein LOC133318648 [Gastrolobium bilobum]